MSDQEDNTRKSFALLLETASQQFNVLEGLVQENLIVTAVRRTGEQDSDFQQLTALSCIQMALAKEFLFNAVRARRICEHAADKIRISRDDRKSFIRALKPIVDVKDVNEHGFDPNRGSRAKESRPAMHLHDDANVAVDETSLIILGHDKILMGPLNLIDVAKPIIRMCAIAGFSSLR